MKKCLILICLIGFSNSVMGKLPVVSKHYICQMKGFSFNLSLSSTNDYTLTYNSLSSHDIVVCLPISQGKYSIVGKNLILDDKYQYHDFKLTFDCSNDTALSVINPTFIGLSNLRFIRNRSEERSLFEFKNRTNNTICNDSVYNTLYYNWYSAGNFFKLRLSKPNKYSYYICDYLFSVGTFKRIIKTNKLILHDTNLNSDFTFYVKKDALVDNFLGFGDILDRNK